MQLNVEEGFSDFFTRCDASAVKWQRRHLTAEQVQLAALVGAAALANFGSSGRIAAAVCFLVAMLGALYRSIEKSDQKWWNGRAGAESAKTLCWRFCVGGLPFAVGGRDDDVRFAERIRDVAKKVADFDPVPAGQAHVTEAMKEVRRRPLGERVALYRDQRIRGQMTWYTHKSEFNSTRSTCWTLATVAAQGLGIVLAFVLPSVDFDFVGLLSSMAAAGAAWVAVKQHDVLARSYAVASSDLSAIDVAIGAREWTEEDEWALFIDDAEEAISREHTSWRASRAV